MRNILRRPRIRGVVVAAALAAGLVGSVASAADADLASPHNSAVAPLAASAPAAETTASADSVNSAESAEAPTDAETAAAATCSTTYLSYGSTGTCVRLLQKNLGALSVDGVYGEATQSRVRSFQDDTSLATTGEVGPQTWAKLRQYGKALGWKSGLTVYMCKVSWTDFRYSAWNNSGTTAWFTLDTVLASDGRRFALSGAHIPDDRIAAQGTESAGAYVSKMLTVGSHETGETQSTTNVRDFSRNTLPACD